MESYIAFFIIFFILMVMPIPDCIEKSIRHEKYNYQDIIISFAGLCGTVYFGIQLFLG